MPEGNAPEIPQTPKLNDMPDASKDISNMLARINQSKPQPEAGQDQKPEDKVKQETEEFLGVLPPELQDSLRGFYRDVAGVIVSQQTTVNGDQAKVELTPDRIGYYKGRLTEIIDSGFLNPHVNPPKKITE